MATLEKGKDKIQQICKVLKEETIQPARAEAERILKEVEQKAASIIEKGRKEAEAHLEDAKKKIAKEKSVFESNLRTSAKMVIESLRQEIEEKLFNQQLQSEISSAAANPKVIASLIESLIDQMKSEGGNADLSAIIPSKVKAEEINSLLGKGVISRLENGGVQLGHFDGGAQVKMRDAKITLDVTDKALTDMLAQYVRKDFRRWLFAE